MNRSELLHAFFMACARNETEEVDHLLEQITEELNEGEGCFGRDEITEAMNLTRDEFDAWEEDPDIGADEDEEEEEVAELPYREDDGDGWDLSSALDAAAE